MDENKIISISVAIVIVIVVVLIIYYVGSNDPFTSMRPANRIPPADMPYFMLPELADGYTAKNQDHLPYLRQIGSDEINPFMPNRSRYNGSHPEWLWGFLNQLNPLPVPLPERAERKFQPRPTQRYGPRYWRRTWFKNLFDRSPPVETPPIHKGDCLVVYHHNNGTFLMRNTYSEILHDSLDWTISMFMKIKRSQMNAPFPFLRKEKPNSRESSPQIVYNPNNNTMTLILKNEFQKDDYLTVPLTNLDVEKYNHFAWVQRRNHSLLYVNGFLAGSHTMKNTRPVIYLGPLLIDSGANYIDYRDVMICNRAQDKLTIRYYMNH